MCGDAGEKVELFACTYQTALGLSRTFILSDSPKTPELQLQGDDLVEVFLVFPQNVFGLEPATVRVREVRIGRAERRAARRHAARSAAASAAPEDLGDVNVNVVVSTGALVSPPALESPGEHDDFFDELGVGPSRPLEPSNDHDNPLTAPTMAQAKTYLPDGPQPRGRCCSAIYYGSLYHFPTTSHCTIVTLGHPGRGVRDTAHIQVSACVQGGL